MHNTSALFLGKTGTGKTAIHKRLLLNDLDHESFVTTITAFSANIPVTQVNFYSYRIKFNTNFNLNVINIFNHLIILILNLDRILI